MYIPIKCYCYHIYQAFLRIFETRLSDTDLPRPAISLYLTYIRVIAIKDRHDLRN